MSCCWDRKQRKRDGLKDFYTLLNIVSNGIYVAAIDLYRFNLTLPGKTNMTDC